MWIMGYKKCLNILLCCILLSLTACGGGGGGSTASTSSANPAPTTNTIPVANAGIFRNVVTGSVVALDGVSSMDADGDILTYKWSITAKPVNSVAILTNSNTVSPGFTADIDGLYIISLTVNDGKSDSLASTVNITASSSQAVLFTTTPSSSGVLFNGVIQAGAVFNLTINNVSLDSYNLDKAELSNGGVIIGATTSPVLLNNNRLGPAETAGVSFTINTATLDKGIRITYFLTNPITQSQFTVYWDFV